MTERTCRTRWGGCPGERTYRLCYIDPRTRLAWFTPAPLHGEGAQTGEGWAKGWYELNSGPPDGDGLLTLGWDGDVVTPCDVNGGNFSVDSINRGEIPWLQCAYRSDVPAVRAGATVGEFAAAVWAGGGDIYIPWQHQYEVSELLEAVETA